MRYAVGVDGGGTKTVAAVVAEGQGPVGSGTAGPANHRSVGVEAAGADVARAVADALAAAGVALAQVDVLCMCLAGFDTDLDEPVPERAVRLLGYAGPAIFENDVIGAWAGATEAGPGVVVIAGTGATGIGMNRAGAFWRTDGWDYLLGDAGSGYAIGLAGIRAAMRALDGRGAPTRLARALGDTYGVTEADGMRRLVDSTTFGKFEIASFAVRVARAADEGDAPARAILARAGDDLGQSARAIVERLGMGDETFPVCTIGSVFKAEPWVTAPFRAAVLRAAPHADLRPPTRPPEVGAALLGLRRLAAGDTGSWTLGRGQRHISRGLRIAELPA